jgi:hypothetical protein
VEVVDSFTFLASEWFDAEIPLQYQFGYVTLSGAEATVRSKTDAAFGQSTLPAGPSASNFTVSCIVRVYDLLAASTSLSYTVRVTKQKVRESNALSTLITAGLTEGAASLDGLKQATSLGAYLLNDVDCSAAPDCASRNRKACFRTKNTCGECLSSLYIGDSGDSNQACVLASLQQGRNQSHTDGTCTTAAECNAFQLCTSGRCISQPMPCAGNCSYPQGICTYVDRDSGDRVAACYVGDTSCKAVCDCAEDYIGSDTCSLNTTELLLKRSLRTQVIEGIQQLVSLEDADEQAVVGWIGSLVSVTQAPDELSESGIASLLSLVDTVISTASDIGMSVDTVKALLSSVDASIEANTKFATQRRRLLKMQGGTHSVAWRLLSETSNGSTLQLAADAVTHFSSFAAASLLPGQDAVEVVLPQFRILVQKLSLLTLSGDPTDQTFQRNVSLSAPRSALEILNGQIANAINFPIDPNADPSKSSLSVALTTLRSELFNKELKLVGSDQLFSSPLSIELSDVLCTGTACRYEIVLQTSSAMSTLAAVRTEDQRYNTSCVAGDFSSHDYDCPDGSVLTAMCDGTQSTVMSRCSITSYSPACNSVAGLTTSGAGCTIVSQTSADITCSCPIPSRRRKLQDSAEASDSSDDGTVSISYVAMLSEVQDNFVDTVVSAQGLNASTVEESWSALVTVGCLAAAVVFGLCWSYQEDAKMEKVKPDMKESKLKASEQLRHSSWLERAMRSAMGLFGRRPTHSRLRSARATICISKDIQIAEQALPAILSSNTLSHRVKDELKHHHKWFGIVFFYSRSFPRVLRVLSLATNVIIMLFIQSITYALTNPDDGTCELLKMETSCLEPDSPYATGQSKCFWDANNSKCALVQPDSDIKVILFVAIFSALVCTPLALLVDWIIMYVLSAPTRQVKPRGDVISAAQSQAGEFPGMTAIVPGQPSSSASVAPEGVSQRKRSSLSRSIFGSVFGSLDAASERERAVSTNAQSDLRELIRELTAYRATLSVEHKAEFDGKTPNFSLHCLCRIIRLLNFFLQFLRSNLGLG